MRVSTAGLVVIAIGCSHKSAPPVARDAVGAGWERLNDQQLNDRIAAMSQAQAGGFAGGTAEVKRAWAYQGPADIVPNAGARLVAAELVLHLPGDTFDPDDIDLVDATDNTNYGSDPQLQRLTDAGEPAPWDDPVFTSQHDFRLIGIWAAPTTVGRIRFDYWDQRLAGPIDITGTGPTIPATDGGRPVAHAIAGKTADGMARHLVLFEEHTGRTAPQPFLQLVGAAGVLIDPARMIEVDATLAPRNDPVDARPYYETRRWVLEFRCKCAAAEINEFGEHTPIPAAKLTPPAALLAALDAPAP